MSEGEKGLLYAYIWKGEYPFAIVVTPSKAYFIEPYGSIEVYRDLSELLEKNSIDLSQYPSIEVTTDIEKVMEFCKEYDVDKALQQKMGNVVESIIREEIEEHTPLRETTEIDENEVLKEWEEYLEQSKPKHEPTAVSDIVIEVKTPEPQFNLEELKEQIEQLDNLIHRIETVLESKPERLEDKLELGVIRGKAIYKEKEYSIYALNSWPFAYEDFISTLKHVFKLVKPVRLCTRIRSFKRFLLLPVEIPQIVLLEPVISFYYNSERVLFIIRDKVVYRSGGRMYWNDLEVHSKTINDALYNFMRTPLIREFYSIEVNLDEEKIVSIENTTREKEKSVFDDLT